MGSEAYTIAVLSHRPSTSKPQSTLSSRSSCLSSSASKPWRMPADRLPMDVGSQAILCSPHGSDDHQAETLASCFLLGPRNGTSLRWQGCVQPWVVGCNHHTASCCSDSYSGSLSSSTNRIARRRCQGRGSPSDRLGLRMVAVEAVPARAATMAAAVRAEAAVVLAGGASVGVPV